MNQFYTVLHSSPQYLYRFYMNDSTLTMAGVGRAWRIMLATS